MPGQETEETPEVMPERALYAHGTSAVLRTPPSRSLYQENGTGWIAVSQTILNSCTSRSRTIDRIGVLELMVYASTALIINTWRTPVHLK